MDSCVFIFYLFFFSVVAPAVVVQGTVLVPKYFFSGIYIVLSCGTSNITTKLQNTAPLLTVRQASLFAPLLTLPNQTGH